MDDEYYYRYRRRRRRGTPFTRLGSGFMASAIGMLYTLFAGLYFFRLVSFVSRTGWHDAFVIAGFLPIMIVGSFWESVKRIRYVGKALYFIPGLALVFSPFILDFYLMYNR